MPHAKIRKQVSRGSSFHNESTFHNKLRWLTLCLFCLATFNFTVLHIVQSTLIDFYGESSFLSFSEDLVASWDTTTYSDDKSILPEKIITVIGKESSGTTFVAKTIAQGLGLPGREKYRDGYFHHERRANDEMPVQVQHVSLPQGAWCLQNHSHHIVDVILPPQCVSTKNGRFPSQSFPGIRRQCEALLNSTIKHGMELYEGMVEMHGPWFMKRHWKNKFYYKAGRYPGRTFAQSAQVRSRNVTTLRFKERKHRHAEMIERKKERRNHFREQLLESAFDENLELEPRNSGEDLPPLVVQRGDTKRFGDSSEPRRLAEVTEENKIEGDNRAKAGAKKEANGPIKYRFEGGEIRKVESSEYDEHHHHHHPPKQRGAFRHDMSKLTKDQQEELKRRMRMADGRALPEDEEELREETPNQRLRRENRERKREMMRRERQENYRREMENSNDDEPKLHGKRVSRLSRQQRIDEWLNRIKLHPLEQLQQNNLLMYPNRFLLNITAQKIWYDAHGTEQVIVIVVRDPEMSLKSRLKAHCHILELAKEEEAIANAILNDAIQTFFLNDKSGFRSGLDGRWYGKTVEEIKQEAFLWDPTPIIENNGTDAMNGDPLYSSRIPMSNNVVLVSYEAMMKYQQDYVLELYKVLGIKSDYRPVFRDGNAKYRNETKAGSIGRRPSSMDMHPYMEEEGGGHGFFFLWLLRQPEEYQGILLAISCASVFVGSFSLWVFIFWMFFRRTAKKRKPMRRGRR